LFILSQPKSFSSEKSLEKFYNKPAIIVVIANAAIKTSATIAIRLLLFFEPTKLYISQTSFFQKSVLSVIMESIAIMYIRKE